MELVDRAWTYSLTFKMKNINGMLCVIDFYSHVIITHSEEAIETDSFSLLTVVWFFNDVDMNCRCSIIIDTDHN